jgi:hypothetical protein
MVLLLALLLQQAPTLTPAGSLDLDDGERLGLAVSATGKYVVLGEPDRLRILDGETLKLVQDLSRRWTAFGFDEQEGHLLVVGDEAALIRTSDWSVKVRAPIPHASFAETHVPKGQGSDIVKNRGLKPGEALILPELDFYYCTEGGRLSLGSFSDGKLEEKPMNLKSDFRISRIYAQLPSVLLLGIENDMKPAITLGGRVNYLVGCQNPVTAMDLGGTVVCIGADDITLHSPASWKVTAHRRTEGTTCAVFDAPSGWVFLGDGQGLRGWHKDKFSAEIRMEAVQGKLLLLAVDASRHALFTLERRALRRWKLSG